MQNNKANWGISVVIPNYNGRLLLEQNLPFTYAALKAVKLPYQVIIADDASTDDSVAYITQNYPDVILIKGEENKGFSGNINRGIMAAGLDLVLLLNSDIKLTENYFLSQLPYFNHADTFGVMGLILDETDDKMQEACKYPVSSVFKINHIKNIRLDGDNAYTFYLSGANALVNRQKLLQLGGFNELFSPFYHEDLDLSLRAWESGFKCYYDDSAVCRHAVSVTIKKHSSKKKIKTISTRNKLLLHYFHLQGLRLYLWAFITFLSLLVRWISGKLYYYQAWWLYLKRLPQMRIYKRNFIQAAKSRQQYMPFITVKAIIKQALDKQFNINK
ncbi:glycosyltransferase family 2 protein [Mucilaginibacter sp. FT3.2]|uniref:glycosyltransferase family 2 protein n=1 Tax=Mucilaginibacter sp. FT3.2 TaxID=2723090 RepID=UPI00162272E1|nr:glycosyltransferase family 2 protein [Mucilaginibacter sp. FT3.2]MBB6232250.1 GT2 family glycosyltransferase [Mucilaginibacter sp. FT3.2]